MIDTHIHLSHEQYNGDLSEVISSAKAKGVEHVILIGCDHESILKSIQIHHEYPKFTKLAVGWHPVDVRDFNVQELELIEETIKNETVVAIGEIGLDYHWHPEEKEEQIKLFELQIELAQKLDLPIIIHAREAYEDCYDILKKYAPVKGVMHSFAADKIMAKKFIDLGMYIGISGPVTFKNGYNQKEVVSEVSLDKLLLETDGPYLTPVPYRGKRNLPEYVEYVAEEIAFNQQISTTQVIEQTTINAKKLFGGNSV